MVVEGQLAGDGELKSGLQRKHRTDAIEPASAPREQDVGAQGRFKVSSSARAAVLEHGRFARLGQRRREFLYRAPWSARSAAWLSQVIRMAQDGAA